MRRSLIAIIVSIFILGNLQAQPFHHLDVNNVDARIHASGDLFWDLFESPMFEVPRGSGKHTIFAAAPWIGGFDEKGNLYMSAQTYRNPGTVSFVPGPLNLKDVSIEPHVSSAWNKVWQISREDVETFRDGHLINEDILTWPAHGDPEHHQADNLAPFQDVSGTGIYEPDSGDYPRIKGDMSLWWVFNDRPSYPDDTLADPMGIEIHAMAYAFEDERPIIDNTIFIEYTFYNRSDKTYEDVYMGKFVDFDIGYPFDDYIGSFPEANTLYGYNAYEYDPGESGYGLDPPAQSMTFLNHDMRHMMTFDNHFEVTGNPTLPIHYYNYLRGRWKDGSPICYGGDGYRNCWDPNRYVDHMFPDDPVKPRGNDENWSEESAGIEPHDRRGVASAGPFTLEPGASIDMALAYTFHDGEGRLENASRVEEEAMEVRHFWDPTAAQMHRAPAQENYKLYPNPASQHLNIESFGKPINNVQLYSLDGQQIMQENNMNQQSTTLNIGDLLPGIYIVRIQSGQATTNRKVVIEE